MAYVGIARPVVAEYQETKGKAEYSGGIRFGKAIRVEITPQYEDVSDYGDINDTEDKQEFSFADVSLNTDNVPEKAEPIMFGHGVSGNEIKSRYDDSAGYVGLGVRTRIVSEGKTRYIVIWLHKVKFTEGSQEHSTRGDSIDYQTPTTEGKAVPDAAGEWRTKKFFETAEEADSWIDAIAGVERED